MYQVIATDLDGTLLDSDHQVDPFTVATLQELQAHGLHFVIATGRHFRDVAGIRDRLGIRPYLVTSNGARVHDARDNRLHAHDLPPDIVKQLVAPHIAGTHGRVIVNLFVDDAWLIDREAPQLLAFHQDSGFRYEVANLATHDGQGVAKVLYIGDAADLGVVERNLAWHFGDALYVTYSLPDCLEVMAASVSKGRALAFVLEQLGLPAERCIAFGDNMNDIDMLESVGHPFMMGNANPGLIARLPYVPRIGNNFEAGVAHHLRALFAPQREYQGLRTGKTWSDCGKPPKWIAGKNRERFLIP
ncbi:Cof-type HAD-IIB family hydrolase [Mycetohabitans rhizoxinica]